MFCYGFDLRMGQAVEPGKLRRNGLVRKARITSSSMLVSHSGGQVEVD